MGFRFFHILSLFCLFLPFSLRADEAARLQLIGTLKDLSCQDSVFLDARLSDSALFKIADKAGKNALTRGRHTEAIKLYEDALSFFSGLSEDWVISKVASIRVVLGAAYEEVGLWVKAMELYISVLEEQRAKVDLQKAAVCNNIANVYFKQGDYNNAKRYLDSAIVINTKLGNSAELVKNYNNLSGLYYVQDEYVRALTALSQALALIDEEKDSDSYNWIWSNMAIVYNKMGKKSVAEEMINSVIELQKEKHQDLDLISSYQFKAEVFDAKHQDSAFFYLQEALRLSRQLANRKVEISVLRDLYRWYYKQGRYHEACRALERRSLLQDSLNLDDNRLQMENIEAAYEITRQRQARELYQREREIQYLLSQRQRVYLWIGIGAMLVALMVLVYRFLLLQRLRKRDQEISQRQKEFHKREKQAMENREKELQESLEIRNKELTAKVLHLVKNNEYILDINRELQQLLLELNPKDKAKKEHIREMLLKLRDQSNEGTYTEFKYYFEQVHQSFYENVQKAYPMLTYKDLRLCSFLRLGLSSKEIAAITFKEVRSVESARNRLRHKMGLDADVKLIEFFSQF